MEAELHEVSSLPVSVCLHAKTWSALQDKSERPMFGRSGAPGAECPGFARDGRYADRRFADQLLGCRATGRLKGRVPMKKLVVAVALAGVLAAGCSDDSSPTPTTGTSRTTVTATSVSTPPPTAPTSAAPHDEHGASQPNPAPGPNPGSNPAPPAPSVPMMPNPNG
ncbi:hypothetical protein ACWDTL_02865, partial [Nocardia farcinica]